MLSTIQKEICKLQGVPFCPPEESSIIGVSLNIRDNIFPINGLRHLPIRDASGWYIWAGGEIPQDEDDFFKPLHYSHLKNWNSFILKYLALPPGWRFLTDGSYEDIWFDETLLVG